MRGPHDMGGLPAGPVNTEEEKTVRVRPKPSRQVALWLGGCMLFGSGGGR